MPYDPLARLHLQPVDFPPPPSGAAVEPAGVPAFPAVPEEPAAPVSASPVDASPPPIPAPAAVHLAAAIDHNLAAPAPPPLSDLDRYRLENDRELLRAIAYRRHFLQREE